MFASILSGLNRAPVSFFSKNLNWCGLTLTSPFTGSISKIFGAFFIESKCKPIIVYPSKLTLAGTTSTKEANNFPLDQYPLAWIVSPISNLLSSNVLLSISIVISSTKTAVLSKLKPVIVPSKAGCLMIVFATSSFRIVSNSTTTVWPILRSRPFSL